MIDPKQLANIERLLALPREMARVGRQLTGLKADKANVEDALKKRELQARVLAAKDPRYAELPNADAKKQFVELQVYEDIEWDELNTRLKQLKVAISKAQVEYDALQDEHQSLRAAIEARLAEVLERKLSDRQLADYGSTGGKNLA